MNQVEAMLQKRKIPCLKAPNWEQAIYHYNQNRIDLVLADKNLDGMPGTTLIQKFRNHEVASKRNPAIILAQSSPMNPETEQLLKELGEVQLINKPIKEPSLISIIAKAMEENFQKSKIHELKINILDPMIADGDFEKAKEICEKKLLPGGPQASFLPHKALKAWMSIRNP